MPPAVLELLGAGGTPASVTPTPALSPNPGLRPHLIPLLLRGAEAQLSDTCQQEIGSKLAPAGPQGAPGQYSESYSVDLTPSPQTVPGPS